MDNFVIGVATWSDKGLLYDIDVKCFDDVWSLDYWLLWFGESNVVFLIKEGVKGPAVGMAVCVCNKDGIVIEKLCVKKQYRRRGASKMLLQAVHDMTAQYKWETPVYLVVPEQWMYRDYDDHEFGLGDWTRSLNMVAKKGILPSYFDINGELMNGIQFLSEVKKPKVPLCWNCNTRVKYLDDGWVCGECGQHGPPDRIVSDWEEGRKLNCPYMGDR